MGPENANEVNVRAAAAAARPDAFISYAREDSGAVDVICDGLTERGYSVWIDRDAVPFSASWTARAEAGIDAATAVVCVLSRHWIESASCRFEYEHALAGHKRLVPVTASQDLAPGELPAPLGELNWIRLGRDDSLDALASTLDSDLPWREMHARLLVRATEWEHAEGDSSFELRGRDLRAAEAWLGRQAAHEQPATALHVAYIVASRRAATRRQRLLGGFMAGALLVTLTLAVLAEWQRQVAVDNERLAAAQRRLAVQNARQSRSRELAALASIQPAGARDRALLLALEGFRAWPTAEALSQLIASVQATGRLEATARAASPVFDVAVAADGQSVAGASGRSVIVWDPRAGGSAGAPLQAGYGARAVAFASRAPGALVTAGVDGAVRLWDVRRSGPGRPVGLPRARYTDVALDPAGRFIAAAGGDGRIQLWDVRRDALVGSPVAAHAGDIREVAFDGRGRILASAGAEDGAVRVWRRGGGGIRPVRRLAGMGSTLDVAFTPAGNALAAASAGATVVLWNWRRHRVIDRIRFGDAGAVLGVAFDSRGTRLAAAGSDGRIRIWDRRAGRAVTAPLLGHAGAVLSVAFADGGRRLVSAGSDRTVRSWQVARGVPLARRRVLHAERVSGVVVSSAGTTVAAGTRAGAVIVADRSGDVHTLHGGPPIVDVALSRDGRVAASADASGSIEVRTVADGRRLRRPPRHPGGQNVLALTSDGTVLASAGWDGAVRLWHARRSGAERTLRSRGPTPATSVAFSSSGQWLAAADLSGEIRLWDAARGRALGAPFGQNDGGRVGALAFSRDGATLAAGDRDGEVQLWDVAHRRPLGPPLLAHGTDVVALAFSTDGRTLASGDAHGKVRLWDVARRRALGGVLAGHRSGLASVTFGGDDTLVTADKEGTVMRWDHVLTSRATDDWERLVCRLVARPLSRSEWAQYVPGEPYRPACAP